MGVARSRRKAEYQKSAVRVKSRRGKAGPGQAAMRL